MSQSRQLAAIMFTDIVGYTKLMGEDEQRAFELLKKNRAVQRPIIEKFNGRWLKEIGDGVLASFTTVSEAVYCAKAIQEACLKEHDLKLRIGIHLGEVVFEGDDVFGDGVNIASRLEPLAPVGGIIVSESVFRNVENKKDIDAEYVGEKELKNVKHPVKIFRIISEGQFNYGHKNHPSIHQQDSEKSIAVLPFVNMSSDPEQEYFSDGLTEEVITDLSQLDSLFVISRSSMMTFKGTAKNIKEIANEVNVRYVLEGSVRRAGNNLRITAQLIDAQKDIYLWAEKYNGSVDDIFDIQENVSKSIVESLGIQLADKKVSSSTYHQIHDATTLGYYMNARYEMLKLTESGLSKAVKIAEHGLEMVGENAVLYGTMSLANLYLHHYGFRVNTDQLEKAKSQANLSLTLDPKCVPALMVLGIFEFYIEYNKLKAASIFKKILEIDQHNPDALRWLASTYILLDSSDSARPISIRLLKLDPLTAETYGLRGWVEYYAGLIKESIPYYVKWLEMDPDAPFTQYACSLAYAVNNQIDKSVELLDSLVKKFPNSIYAKFASFFKHALKGNKTQALRYATQELRNHAESLDWLSSGMAFGYAFLKDYDETVKWCWVMLNQDLLTYRFYQNIEVFHTLQNHPGFQEFISEVKKRSEAVEI